MHALNTIGSTDTREAVLPLVQAVVDSNPDCVELFTFVPAWSSR